MTFKEVQEIFESKFGVTRLADIARELEVTPQVVSNWKARNQIPYKYVKKLRLLISDFEKSTIVDPIKTKTSYKDYNELSGEDNIDIKELVLFFINKIKRRIVLFLFIPSLICTIQIINVFYFIEPTYISSAKIMPESGSASSASISGFASQFGINVGSKGSSPSSLSELYPEILKSRTLSRRLLERKFDTKRFGEGQSLLKIITYGNSKPPTNLDNLKSLAITNLIENKISVKTKLQSPLITISAHTFEAKFSAQLAGAVIDELSKIEKQYMTGKATEKRIFISNRIKEAEIDLKNSEEKLKSFREKNRNIVKSPALQLEVTRLLREQEVQTQIYLTLKKELELVQIEEVEKGSMVMILDPPEVPLGRSSPNKPRILIITGIIGLIISMLVIMYRDIYDFIIKELLEN